MLDLVLKVLHWAFKTVLRPLFCYPVEMEYVAQEETEAGYVLHLTVKSLGNRVVTIPKENLFIKIVKNPEIEKQADKSKIVFGERALVFDSPDVLKAHISGRSYGNVRRHIVCGRSPVLLHLLITVKGPGSTNPSLRFQIAQLYVSFRISLRKWLLRIAYLEVPIRHIPLVTGNKMTTIIDE